MNEENQDISLEYIKNLPQAVKDVVYDGIWEERTDEIAKKYSLNDTQTDSLVNNVLYILTGLLNPDDFLETIITELNVSRLLAEQIMEDLEVRVFEYAFRSIENKEKKGGDNRKSEVSSKEGDKSPTPSALDNTLDLKDDIPEVRPETVPMIEEEGVHIEPTPEIKPPVKPQEIPRVTLGQAEPATETVSPPASVKVTEFFSQQPTPAQISPTISDTVPLVKPPEPVPQPVPQNQTGSVVPPNPIPPAPKRYAVDPYREPIE